MTRESGAEARILNYLLQILSPVARLNVTIRTSLDQIQKAATKHDGNEVFEANSVRGDATPERRDEDDDAWNSEPLHDATAPESEQISVLEDSNAPKSTVSASAISPSMVESQQDQVEGQ